jgi:hypothetical protein
MSTLATTPVEYKVVSFDADSTAADLTSQLNKIGQEGWTLASTYHLHHLNTVFYVFARPTTSTR